MKVNVRLLVVVTLVTLSLMMILVACTPDASGFILSPNLSAQIAARDAGDVVTVIKEEVKTLADLSQEEIYAGVPEEIMAEIPTVDVATAEDIRLKHGCIGCHSLDGTDLAGPTWKGLGNRAVSRVKGESPAFYIYQSIVAPSDFLAEGRTDQMTSRNFKETMTPAEIATMIQFVLGQ